MDKASRRELVGPSVDALPRDGRIDPAVHDGEARAVEERRQARLPEPVLKRGFGNERHARVNEEADHAEECVKRANGQGVTRRRDVVGLRAAPAPP